MSALAPHLYRKQVTIMLLTKNKKQKHKRAGQVIIEFTFCMIIVFLMIYSLIMIFRWTGTDLADRRISHERTLRSPINRNYTLADPGAGPLTQIDPFFYKPVGMNAIWDGFRF